MNGDLPAVAVIAGTFLAIGVAGWVLNRLEKWSDARHLHHDRAPLTTAEQTAWRALRRQLGRGGAG